MRQYRLVILWGFVVALLLLGGAYYQSFLWDECRGAGHSFMYCVHVVTR